MTRRVLHLRVLIGVALLASSLVTTGDWRHYGGDLAGRRLADVAVGVEDVAGLTEAWRFQTGDPVDFKATPVLVDDLLVFPTGRNRVFAIDAASGHERWRHDPGVDYSRGYSEQFTARGVAVWSRDGDVCSPRILFGTQDARLIALDAATGEPCVAFGRDGAVDLRDGIDNFRRFDYSVTSAPTVVGDIVVVGSAVGDNGRVAVESGVVRGYDADTGALRWHWDPIPRHAEDVAVGDWQNEAWRDTGAANVWSTLAADAERDLVFLPTTSPAPDFYGGERLGDNRHANSIVALTASTGAFVWGYQTIHHDLWDYDLAAQPLLVDIEKHGKRIPAVVHAGKTGFVFVLNRMTGDPLFPVEERPVPLSHVAGEQASPTQPFPALRLHPTEATMPQIFASSPAHAALCQRLIEGVRFDGIFTPPSLGGSLLFPGNPGGVNWGSMAADGHGRAYVIVNRWPTIVRLIPRSEFRRMARVGTLAGVEAQFTAQRGTPYGMARYEFVNPATGTPCHRGPWSRLVALDLGANRVLWERPAGVLRGQEDHPVLRGWGAPLSSGGPMVTRGGVVFIASRVERRLRAYAADDGRELWHADLPAEPEATPMGYSIDGRAFVVVAAGGARPDGAGRGDYLVAFSSTDDDAAASAP